MKLYHCRMCGSRMMITYSNGYGHHDIVFACIRGHRYIYPNTQNIPDSEALRWAIRAYNGEVGKRHAQ